MEFRCTERSPGYWLVTGGHFSLHIVEVDRVAAHEDDDVLRLFSHEKPRTLEARRFLVEQFGSKEANMALEELEGFDELMQKFLDTLSPEQRMAGLAPEQVLAAIPPEQLVLSLPDAVLRGLSEDYIATLPEPVQRQVRARRAR